MVKDWKKALQTIGLKKKADVTILISNKIDCKLNLNKVTIDNAEKKIHKDDISIMFFN